MFKAMKVTALALSAAMMVSACGGGGGSTSTGGVYYTHEQLASAFVNRAWGDAGLDLTLVKTNTLQYNYIVVYDEDHGTYDAYYIGNYNVGENIGAYINRNSSRMYYDLDYVGANQYEDWFTGLLFEETTGMTKDADKAAGIVKAARIAHSAKRIQAEFGLSADQAVKAARTAVYMNDNMNKLSRADIDSATKSLSGSSYTAWQKAQGNQAATAQLLLQAQETTGLGPAAASNLAAKILNFK